MHLFGIFFFGLIAVFWITYGLKGAYGAARLPWLKDFAATPDSDCPRISLIFAARDEQEQLPSALATLMGIDYLNLEIIAADDRTNDVTRKSSDYFWACHPSRREGPVTNRPPGRLGKPHALQE